jgi:hypothetical protein
MITGRQGEWLPRITPGCLFNAVTGNSNRNEQNEVLRAAIIYWDSGAGTCGSCSAARRWNIARWPASGPSYAFKSEPIQPSQLGVCPTVWDGAFWALGRRNKVETAGIVSKSAYPELE